MNLRIETKNTKDIEIQVETISKDDFFLIQKELFQIKEEKLKDEQ